VSNAFEKSREMIWTKGLEARGWRGDRMENVYEGKGSGASRSECELIREEG